METEKIEVFKECQDCDWHGWAGHAETCHCPKSKHNGIKTDATFSCTNHEDTRFDSIRV
jgi:hypothetical protein